jgi:hypothetical protein
MYCKGMVKVLISIVKYCQVLSGIVRYHKVLVSLHNLVEKFILKTFPTGQKKTMTQMISSKTLFSVMSCSNSKYLLGVIKYSVGID